MITVVLDQYGIQLADVCCEPYIRSQFAESQDIRVSNKLAFDIAMIVARQLNIPCTFHAYGQTVDPKLLSLPRQAAIEREATERLIDIAMEYNDASA